MSNTYKFGITSSLANIGDVLKQFSGIKCILSFDGAIGTGKSTLMVQFKNYLEQLNEELVQSGKTININGIEYGQIYTVDVPSIAIDSWRDCIESKIYSPAYQDSAIFFFREEAADIKIDALGYLKEFTDNVKHKNLFYLWTSNDLMIRFSTNVVARAIFDRTIVIPFHNPKKDHIQQLIDNLSTPDVLIDNNGIEKPANEVKAQFMKFISGPFFCKISYRTISYNLELMSKGKQFDNISFLELEGNADYNKMVKQIMNKFNPTNSNQIPDNLAGISWMLKDVTDIYSFFFTWLIAVTKLSKGDAEMITKQMKLYSNVLLDTTKLNQGFYNVAAMRTHLALILYFHR